MQSINVTIEGVPPGLLQHRFPEITAAELTSNVKLAGKGKLSDEEYAELAAYRLKTGDLCQPSEHVFQSLLKAAANFQIQEIGRAHV